MKVVGIEFGRLAMLVDIIELGTRQGIYLPEAAQQIQARYSFVHSPNIAPSSQNPQVFRFEQGRLMRDQGLYSVSAFEVHPHGLVVQAPDTDTAEAFLKDFLMRGQELGWLKLPERAIPQVFTSALIVEFEQGVEKGIKKWAEISALFNDALKERYGIKEGVHLETLEFKPDPQKLPSRMVGLLSNFTLQRRIYAPYEQQKFYSTAPVKTDEHIRLLGQFEKALSGR